VGYDVEFVQLAVPPETVFPVEPKQAARLLKKAAPFTDPEAVKASLLKLEGCRPGPKGAIDFLGKGLSYARIELWLGKTRHEPVAAELYVQSDKLAKLARFVVDKPAAPTKVDEMVLQDRLGNHLETRVRYLSRSPKAVPEAWLNPMFLARNPALE
jgi:hypothetical protein